MNNSPVRGPFDTTQDSYGIIQIQNSIVYLLVRAKYSSGDDELIFTPYFSGVYPSSNTLTDFFMYAKLDPDGSFEPPVVATSIPDQSGTSRTLASAQIANLVFANGKLTSPDKLTAYTTQVGGNYATFLGSQSDQYTLTADNSFFYNSPTAYYGYTYTLTSNNKFPFRFLAAQTNPDIIGRVIKPSYCNGTLETPFRYMCFNNLSSVNRQYYLNFPVNVVTQVSTIYQISFLPTSYYPGNYRLLGNNLVPSIKPCQIEDTVFNVVYFLWASGNTTVNNLNGSTYTLQSQATQGFIPQNNTTVSVLGWSDSKECSINYFYNYCGVGTCGSCYGPCNTGECEFNKNMKPQSKGISPFECTSQNQKDDWKVILVVVLAIVIFFILFMIMLKIAK